MKEENKVKKIMGKQKGKFPFFNFVPNKFMNLAGILTVLILISGGWARASENIAVQSINMQVAEMCTLNVNGNPDKLIMDFARSKGESSQSAINNSTYIQYSSAVARNKRRNLTVRLESSDSTSLSCLIKLQAILSGKKNEGICAGQIVLSTTPQSIIIDIGSCATGAGATDGARLIYAISIDNRANLVLSEIKPVVVILEFVESL